MDALFSVNFERMEMWQFDLRGSKPTESMNHFTLIENEFRFLK